MRYCYSGLESHTVRHTDFHASLGNCSADNRGSDHRGSDARLNHGSADAGANHARSLARPVLQIEHKHGFSDCIRHWVGQQNRDVVYDSITVHDGLADSFINADHEFEPLSNAERDDIEHNFRFANPVAIRDAVNDAVQHAHRFANAVAISDTVNDAVQHTHRYGHAATDAVCHGDRVRHSVAVRYRHSVAVRNVHGVGFALHDGVAKCDAESHAFSLGDGDGFYQRDGQRNDEREPVADCLCDSWHHGNV